MTDHDTELMLRVQRGETECYRELFDRHYPRAVNTVYRYLGSRETAEDVAMEAFARILESRGRFRADAKFNTYLYRTLLNLAINESRRRRPKAEVNVEEMESADEPGSDPGERVQKSSLASEVRKAILALPPNQRLALVLTRYDGLSYKDAAAAMNTSVKAVESLLHRAKSSIRTKLKDFIE